MILSEVKRDGEKQGAGAKNHEGVRNLSLIEVRRLQPADNGYSRVSHLSQLIFVGVFGG